MSNPAPNLQVARLVSDALAKCAPRPIKYRRSSLQLAPRGWSCRCGACALVCEDDSAWCADCALPVFGIDELYAVTRGYDEDGDVLGAALDGFARAMERAAE